MYRDREDVVFNLRVHGIPSFMDYLDYNSAAVGMTYRSSTVPGGVAVNGVDDAVPDHHAHLGSDERPAGHGHHDQVVQQLGGPRWNDPEYYHDQTTATDPQCWDRRLPLRRVGDVPQLRGPRHRPGLHQPAGGGAVEPVHHASEHRSRIRRPSRPRPTTSSRTSPTRSLKTVTAYTG